MTVEAETAPHGNSGKTAYLDRELWQSLAQADSREDFCMAWLRLQCSMVHGVSGAVVVFTDADGESFSPVAVWPEQSHGITKLLQETAEAALAEQCGVVLHSDNKTGHTGVAFPIVFQGELYGAIALEVSGSTDSDVELLMRLLQWGIGWQEAFFLRKAKAEDAGQKNAMQALDLAAMVLEQTKCTDAASVLVTELALLMQSDRVSIGLFRKSKSRLLAISHNADFEKKMQLVRGIEAMMDEAAEQQLIIRYPPVEDGNAVEHLHARFAHDHHMGALMSVPLAVDAVLWGVMVFERKRNESFDKDDVTFCDAVAALVGPVLELKYRNDRILPLKMKDSMTKQFKRLFGPRYLVRKCVIGVFCGLVLFFSFAVGDFRVNAQSEIEGAIRRVIPAPQNGFIAKAYFRSGDRVKKGDVLCQLDDRDLRLEEAKWAGKLGEIRGQYHNALAKHDKTDIRIAQAKIKQAEAQLALTRMQLAKTVIQAPFDGIIVLGDLSQSLGAPKEKGDVLFEIAPLSAYRVSMQVREQDIQHLKRGQPGMLRLSALSEEVFDFNIKKITPVTHVIDGGNFFRVEARLGRVSDQLRPGMKGVGKIEIGKRKLWWIWTHNLVDWVRLKLWAWLP